MAKIDLKKSVKELGTFLTTLNVFGTKVKPTDQFIFDRRGAIKITDKEIVKKNGDRVKIRGIEDAGQGKSYTPNDSLMISRPSTGNFVEASKAMDANHGWVYACIKAIADEVANTDFKVYQTRSDGESIEIESHPIIDFLDAINDFQTGPEFKHMLVSHLELTGNAYILLEGVTNEMSQPTAMYLLDPGRVRVHLDKTTYPFKINKYEFTFDSRKWFYEPYQIVQLKYPDPSNPYLGLGTVQAIAEWIDNDNSLTNFLRKFFQNGAQLGMIFETDMSGEDQLMELRDSFNEQHSSTENAWKAIFLPKNVKKPTSETSMNDVGLNTLSDTVRDKILAGFRVSMTILGTSESDTNRSTAETADYVFARRTIKPKMQLICSYLNEFLVPRFGKNMFVTFEDNVPEDVAAKSTEMKNAIGTVPVITPNEARKEYLNLEPTEGGDGLLIPNNIIPVSMAGQQPSYPSTTPSNLSAKKELTRKVKLGYKPRASKAKTQFAKSAEVRQEMSRSLSDKIAEIVLASRKQVNKEMSDAEYEDIVYKGTKDRIDVYSEKIKGEIRKLNDRQEKEVIKHLPNAIKTSKKKDVDPATLFNVERWIGITIDALTPIASDLFKKEAEQALVNIGSPAIDVYGSVQGQSAIKQAMNLLGRSYNETVIDTLTAKLNEALNQGYSLDEMTQTVKDIYAWNNEVAAERVARTETTRIANDANKLAWKQSGRVRTLKWYTSKDASTVCSFCDAHDGEIIDIDENFYEKGDTISDGDGNTMQANYSSIGGPPLHPNCNCILRPWDIGPVESSMEHKEDKEVDEAISELNALDHVKE